LEYRVGPYFCLAVNIKSIQWLKLLAVTARDLERRRSSESSQNEGKKAHHRVFFLVELPKRLIQLPRRLRHLSLVDAVAYLFSFLHNLHWTLSIPSCWLVYQLLGTAIREFILASVMDDVFSFVERKGMEMDVKVCATGRQAVR